jgi:CRP-like cAMP-binding protein
MNKNALLGLLTHATQEAILSKAERIDLNLSQVICLADKPTTHVYFPINCFIAITQSVDEHLPLEVGMIGKEGLLGSEITLGIKNNTFSALVQGRGSAWKIDSDTFLSQIRSNPKLKEVIHTYLAIRINQLGLSSACEHFHAIGPRLAKWLLMSQDRAQSHTFFMTHEFISMMLGVRRVGITTTAADFRRRGLIDYHRGRMMVLNRVALKAEACSCYLKNRKIYSSLIE